MSSTNATDFTNGVDNAAFTQQPPPSHHIHRESEILPGARGAEHPAPNYDASVTNDDKIWTGKNERQFGAGTDTGAVMAGGQHTTDQTGLNAGQNRLETQRSDVEPPQGGVPISGQSDLPEGHPKFTDKIIGKAQQVAGKAMGKPTLQEKGGLREAGGKQAATGQATLPHD